MTEENTQFTVRAADFDWPLAPTAHGDWSWMNSISTETVPDMDTALLRLRQCRSWIEHAVREAVFATMSSDGCVAGKEGFIRSIGVQVPNAGDDRQHKYEVTVTMNYITRPWERSPFADDDDCEDGGPVDADLIEDMVSDGIRGYRTAMDPDTRFDADWGTLSVNAMHIAEES